MDLADQPVWVWGGGCCGAERGYNLRVRLYRARLAPLDLKVTEVTRGPRGLR